MPRFAGGPATRLILLPPGGRTGAYGRPRADRWRVDRRTRRRVGGEHREHGHFRDQVAGTTPRTSLSISRRYRQVVAKVTTERVDSVLSGAEAVLPLAAVVIALCRRLLVGRRLLRTATLITVGYLALRALDRLRQAATTDRAFMSDLRGADPLYTTQPRTASRTDSSPASAPVSLAEQVAQRLADLEFLRRVDRNRQLNRAALDRLAQ